MKLFSVTPKDMIIRYSIWTTLLLVILIKSLLVQDDYYMCSEGGGCDDIDNYKLWGNIGQLISVPLIFGFSLFQAISFYRFIILKTAGSKKLFSTKIILSVFSLVMISIVLFVFQDYLDSIKASLNTSIWKELR